MSELSMAAERLLKFAIGNNGFIPMVEARKNNPATAELLDAILIVGAVQDSLDGYKLTNRGRSLAESTEQ